MSLGAKKAVAFSAVGVCVLVIGAYVARGTLFAPADPAQEILAELKDKPLEQRMDAMREMRAKSETMSEEERQRLREGMREMMQEEMATRMNAYFNAPEEEKVAVLDKHLEEMVAMRKRWEAERKEREAERAARGEDGRDRAAGEDGAQRGPRQRGPQTRAERKTRLESSNPDQQVKRRQYFLALMARAKEKGVDMGRGPGRGPGGGPGRGPGGGRGR